MTEWTAAPFVPDTRDIRKLAAAASACTGCPLHIDTTQTVFGEGRTAASMVLVGEQPGDQEDRQGHPFVGPAGRVLWQCLEQVGAARESIYVTNAVKHFKHEMRGKRRLHKKPATDEIEACHPWLEAELRTVRSPVIVALGAVAARALFGRAMGIEANRGRTFEIGGRTAFITYHPSAVLRADERATEVRAALVADLASAWQRAAAAARTSA